MSRDVASALLSVAAPGGLPITPCIESDPSFESDCSVIRRREQVRFGMPLLRFRDALNAITPSFRVRCFASPRNDDYSDRGAVALPIHRRRHPRKRVIQYSRAAEINREAAAYWIPAF